MIYKQQYNNFSHIVQQLMVESKQSININSKMKQHLNTYIFWKRIWAERLEVRSLRNTWNRRSQNVNSRPVAIHLSINHDNSVSNYEIGQVEVQGLVSLEEQAEDTATATFLPVNSSV